jgi:hypothetical protein
MKQFKDLEFKTHVHGEEFGIQARIQFDNGYGASVVKGPHTYGGDKDLYELAVMDGQGNGPIYFTPITDDVIGYLRPEDVTDVMIKIQQLPKPSTDGLFEDGYTE